MLLETTMHATPEAVVAPENVTIDRASVASEASDGAATDLTGGAAAGPCERRHCGVLSKADVAAIDVRIEPGSTLPEHDRAGNRSTHRADGISVWQAASVIAASAAIMTLLILLGPG